jgi:hypothetical protein
LKEQRSKPSVGLENYLDHSLNVFFWARMLISCCIMVGKARIHF